MSTNPKSIIRENSKIFRKKRCAHHKRSYFQKVCTHSTCVQSTELSFLCNQCYHKHPGNHNGLIQYYLEFNKIFSENVFADIELLENECLNVLLENKQKIDTAVDRHCDFISEQVTKLLESIKSRIKLKYSSNDLINAITKLKESLKTEYNTLFSIDEANIKDQDIRQYLEFYLNFEKKFEQIEVKSEEMEIYESLQNELSSIFQLFDQKLKDVKSIWESDIHVIG